MNISDFASIDDLARGLRQGRWTAADLTRHALDRINRHNDRLSAFVSVTAERALREAEGADARLASDPNAPALCGIPYAAKDIIDVAGEVTGGGCPVLKNNRAQTDATVIARLAEAGMVLLGKTRTSPLACEITGLNHSEKPARNPWKEEPHVTGGSSSGSAAAVAAGLVPMALGSDTAGSIRTPAALCGITGFKSTLGQVSRSGMLPLCESYDTVGVLTRTPRDVAKVYLALQGSDPGDPSTQAAHRKAKPDRLDDLRFVVAEGPLFESVDAEVERAVRDFARRLAGSGVNVESRSFPIFAEVIDSTDRWDQMDGESWKAVGGILTAWGEDRDPLADGMMPGADVTEERIVETRSVQFDFQRRFEREIADVDVLITPTVRATTRPIDTVEADYKTHVGYYVRNTVTGNYLNLCGISLPCGLDERGRPIGVMLYAKPFADDLLLAVGEMLQMAGFLPDLRPHGFP